MSLLKDCSFSLPVSLNPVPLPLFLTPLTKVFEGVSLPPIPGGIFANNIFKGYFYISATCHQAFRESDKDF